MRSLLPMFSKPLIVVAMPFLAACGATRHYDSVEPNRSADAPSRLAAPAPQDRDYSVSTLFNDQHGETLSRLRGYNPNLRASFLQENDQQIKGETGSFDISEVRFDANFEMPVDPNSWLSVGAHVRGRDFSFSSGVVGVDDDERLHETGLVLGGGTFIDEGFLLEGQFEPGAYSDFEGGLKSDDWQFFGQLHATMQQNENLFFKFGARRDNLFEDLDLYPQLGVVWTFLEEWRLDVLLPNHIELIWNPRAELLLNVGLELDGNEYQVRTPSSLGKQRFTWQAQELRVYAGGTWRFDDLLSTFGRVGGTIGGDYEFNGTNGQTDGTPESAFFFEVGLGLDW